MKHYLQLFGSYVVIAVAAVALYAPWFLGLSPADPSILRAGLSIICGVVLAGAFAGSTLHTVRALQAPEIRLLSAGQVSEPEDVKPTLMALAKTDYVGSFAADALAQVQSAERKRARLEKAISAKFEINTMSWEKFTSVVDAAYRTVLRNAAQLANKIQTFDTETYAETQAGSQRKGTYAASEFASQRRALYEGTIDEMREILTANERLLLELSRLEDELGDLEDSSNRAANNRMVDEVQELVNQTKYYSS